MSKSAPQRRVAISWLLLLGAAAPAGAQQSTASYDDETARTLHEAAMEARARLDDTVLRYTAVVRQRIGASLRTPLKDRTLYRMESAHRVFWSRDGENVVQVLALREQTPVGLRVDVEDQGLFDQFFDPMDDRLFFGLADDGDDMGDPQDDDFWFEHPLYPEYVASYRFLTGDTLRLSLPDGRSVLAVELQVIPRVADVHRMTGSLWIEPRTGSLVRAVYRLADTFDAFRDIPDLRAEEDEDLRFVPGLFKPWTAEISMIAVDYSLWDFDVWLPRSMRMEGVVAAGILKAPMAIEVAYAMEAVTTERDLAEEPDVDSVAEVHFRTRSEAMAYLNELAFGGGVAYRLQEQWSGDDGRRTRFLVPADPQVLLDSPHLPPPIWEDAPGFTSADELRGLFDGLASLPSAPLPQIPATLRWGLQRPDLIRYNRVEALSLGVRGQIRPRTFLGPLTMTGTARLGIADLEPNGRVDIIRETLRRRVALGLFSELAAFDEGGRHLGIGNSLMAALFGRDDGDYYRRSGASVEWSPPSAGRPSFRVRGYGEYQRPATVETDFALFRSWGDARIFRPNGLAAEGWEYGATIEMSPWWGSDPFLTQGGIEIFAQAATGDAEFARASFLSRIVFPVPADTRLALEAAVGSSWGAPSPQRLWYVGGSRTLRGYDPLVAGGATFARGRAELAHTFRFGSVSLFGDAAWAGERDRFHYDDALVSVGLGLSVLDGLIRLDGAYGIRAPRGFRLELYLDGVL